MPLTLFSSHQPRNRVFELRGLALMVALLLATNSASADNYNVTLDAPKEVTELLNNHLDIIRYQPRPDIKDDYLDFLIENTPEQVASLMTTLGYFDARTDVTQKNVVNPITGQSRPELTVKITTGKRIMVKSAKLEVTGLMPQQDPKRVSALEFDWSLQEDEPFTQADWDLAKTLLLRKVQSDAYAGAKFTQKQATILPDDSVANLSATLDSGPYFTLGDVDITGLRRYPASVVQNVNVIEMGEAYNRDKLLDYQKRLQNLPYFSSVIVSVSNAPEEAQLTPIKVQLVELPTQNFKGLVGYGTDKGYRANTQYSHNNVFNRGWIFESKADYQRVDREFMASLDTPQNSRHYFWRLLGRVEQEDDDGLRIDTNQVGLHYSKKLEHSAISYELDFYRNRARINELDTTSRALFGGVTWSQNKVDNPSFPRRGYAIEASIGGASKNLGSTADFLRAYGRYRYFIPFLKKDSLLLRTEAGTIFTRDDVGDIPTSLRFWSGGSGSIRGYAYQSLGDTDNDVVFPAKYLATASAEYTHWFNDAWGAAAFYDVGMTTSVLKNISLYHGAGLGARWHSPVGPIHLDVAYGYPRKKISPHISIGILF